jgi:mono/diheme cytochrome c family protein
MTIMVVAIILGVTFSSFNSSWATTSSVNDTAKIYEAKCAKCHGADGAGTPMGQKMKAPDLRASDVQKKSDDLLFKAIAKGEKSFHQLEKSMSEKEIRQLVGYIRTLGKKK